MKTNRKPTFSQHCMRGQFKKQNMLNSCGIHKTSKTPGESTFLTSAVKSVQKPLKTQWIFNISAEFLMDSKHL